MGRPVVLSNGQLFVGLDESGEVHDFYYPYVGLENLTNARSMHHKIGIWVDGRFSWTDEPAWQKSINFETAALISQLEFKNPQLSITLRLQDYIDSQTNSLIRHIDVINEANKEADVRLFMHQVFQISRAGRADTALFVPDGHYILDYKGRYSLLIGGKFRDGHSFDQYAVGVYAIEGKAGTYLDAEDGELSMNPVEHGGVDSVIRFRKKLKAKSSVELDYWIIAHNNQTDAEKIHDEFKNEDMLKHLNQVRDYWQAWLNSSGQKLPTFHRQSLAHSLLIIKAHCDERGSVLASGDSSIFNYYRDYYCYCWPRDSMYALWPLVRLGHYDEVKKFIYFARDTMHPDGYVMHKYQPDRAIGSTWHPLIHNRHQELAIQEDETASVLFLIGEYFTASKDITFVQSLYRTFIAPCANFMASFIDQKTGLPHASYDLWEEKFLTTTYSTCTVIAGLETAATLATAVELPEDALKWQKAADSIKANLDKLVGQDGYFVKGYLLSDQGELQYDQTIDVSSLYGAFMFGGLSLKDPRLIKTAKVIEAKILDSSPIGGALRYENDGYFLSKKQYKGNPWVISTLWMAQYYRSLGKRAQALKLLEWVVSRELPSGALSEQYDPETGEPLGVVPLVWSHAELVNTILDLAKD